MPSSPARGLVVMARSPFEAVGTIKTRLAPVIPRERDRQALYLAFLRDTVARCRAVVGDGFRLAFTPTAAGGGLDALGVGEHERLAQRGGDLGARERHVFEDMFASGFEHVVLIGSDLPTLPASHLRQAFEALVAGADLVLGPADDGGYYLMGLRRSDADTLPASLAGLFEGIRWSTEHALDDTRRAAAAAGVTPVILPAWHDVDDADGWVQLLADLEDPALAAAAPATVTAVAAVRSLGP